MRGPDEEMRWQGRVPKPAAGPLDHDGIAAHDENPKKTEIKEKKGQRETAVNTSRVLWYVWRQEK